MLFFVSLLAGIGALGGNLLQNTEFADDLAHWNTYPADINLERVKTEEGPALAIEVGPDQEVSWHQALQRVPARPGERFGVRVKAQLSGLRDGVGAVLSLSFFNEAGERVGSAESALPFDADDWYTLTMRGEAPPDTAEAGLMVLLNGRGRALFLEPELRRLATPDPEVGDEPVTITVTDEVTCPALVGFGAEDDGWFYNEYNAERGVDEEAIAIRETRVAWMSPDYVRMFFWYMDWNASLDGETFTWDTDNMRSHYRTLDLYQALGARVNVTGVEWALGERVWENPENTARAVGALLEHLVVEKGYTCVRDWTLTNEPNLFFGADFDTFVELHRLVKEEIERRGLDINIVGSDDAMGLTWFTRCVQTEEYYDLCDLFSSHFYFWQHDLPFAYHHFRDRTDLLETKTPVKPFIVGEFGLRDERSQSPDINPYMKDYDYALNVQRCFIDGLNAGVAGFVIWCMQEVYYPGAQRPMQYGLWGFGGDWPVRPVYHVIASFTRNSETGDVVRRCVSSNEGAIRAALAGDTLFWVNLADRPVTVGLEGFDAAWVRIMEEGNLEGDRETGLLVTPADNRFEAPARSFGYATAKQ